MNGTLLLAAADFGALEADHDAEDFFHFVLDDASLQVEPDRDLQPSNVNGRVVAAF